MNEQQLANAFGDVFQHALDRQHMNLFIDEVEYQGKNSTNVFDAQVNVSGKNIAVEFKVEIHPQHVPQFVEYKEKLRIPLLVFARYITPKAKELLMEAGVNYLDMAGNIFLLLQPIRIREEGRKPVNEGSVQKGRAFTRAGATVVFQLLMNPLNANETYRGLAEKAGVSLGTIPKVIDQLKKDGFLIPKNNDSLVLVNFDELLNRWITVFREKLLDPRSSRRFRPAGMGPNEFFQAQRESELLIWAGEAGADLLTRDLRPQHFPAYSRMNASELIPRLRLVPDDEGPIEIRKPFWEAMSQPLKACVHPILVYAEIVGAGDSRNQAIAHEIKEEYLNYG